MAAKSLGTRIIIILGMFAVTGAGRCAAGDFASAGEPSAPARPIAGSLRGSVPGRDRPFLQPGQDGRQREWHVLLAVHGASVLADLVSTQRALDRGALEGNPLLDWGGDDHAVKLRALAGVGLTFSLQHLHKTRPRLARRMVWAAIILNAAVAAHNAGQGR